MAIGTYTVRDLFLGTNATQRLKIDGTTGEVTLTGTIGDRLYLYNSGNNSGNNGIYIDSDIYPAIRFNNRVAFAGTAKIVYNTYATGYGAASLNGSFIMQGPNALQFSSGGDNVRLTIASGGNVGIGTTIPAELFQVTGGRIYANGTGTSSGITWNNYNIYQDASTNLVFRNGTTERMRIESGNNILLGNTVDTGIAVMVFGGGFANQTTLDTNYRFQGPNNSTTKAKAYAWDTYSDIRIKKDINTLDYGLTQILSLNPVSYNQYDSEIIDDTLVLKETYKSTIGLIAQEVNNSIPEAVGVGNNTELWSLDYTKLIPVLVKAIQEQQAQIEILKNK